MASHMLRIGASSALENIKILHDRSTRRVGSDRQYCLCRQPAENVWADRKWPYRQCGMLRCHRARPAPTTEPDVNRGPELFRVEGYIDLRTINGLRDIVTVGDCDRAVDLSSMIFLYPALLHFQFQPFSEARIVQCVLVGDVIVDRLPN